MTLKFVHLPPIVSFIWFPLTFMMSYGIAVYRKDVRPIFPYISDTANWAPESCIFGTMLTIGALLMILIIYVRYRQLKDVCERNELEAKIVKLNTSTWYLGLAATFGVILVANFQLTVVFVVHIIGATLAFGGVSLYQLLQILISYMVYPTFGSKTINMLRLFLGSLSFISFSGCSGFGIVALWQFHGDDMTKWGEEDGGYQYHLISSIFEWILVTTSQLFFVTFVGEFKLIQFSEPELSAKPVV